MIFILTLHQNLAQEMNICGFISWMTIVWKTSKPHENLMMWTQRNLL